ncbi:MAG TPA: hypothetical protein VLN56_03050 [Gammaproteobacteria bacterium]|nr:hypothetical protein [Gammaproteobacteria bacterium]
MPHDFPVPETDRLEALLKQAFAAMQEAEPARLNRLEERLVRRLSAAEEKKSPNRIPWWIVLLLAGGFASAAWWAGEKWLGNETATSVEQEMHSSESKKVFKHEMQADPEPVDQTGEQPETDESESPVIYWREGH